MLTRRTIIILLLLEQHDRATDDQLFKQSWYSLELFKEKDDDSPPTTCMGVQIMSSTNDVYWSSTNDVYGSTIAGFVRKLSTRY